MTGCPAARPLLSKPGCSVVQPSSKSRSRYRTRGSRVSFQTGCAPLRAQLRATAHARSDAVSAASAAGKASQASWADVHESVCAARPLTSPAGSPSAGSWSRFRPYDWAPKLARYRCDTAAAKAPNRSSIRRKLDLEFP
ncbi:cell differentiation protein rcd1 protein [Apiospora arundinis]